MKLKLRINTDDLKKIIIFAIVLLYLVAIAVLNVGEFIHENKLHGLNPIPAFTTSYFFPTMVFYLAALIGMISTVSSSIFEREKGGPGIVVGKNQGVIS